MEPCKKNKTKIDIAGGALTVEDVKTLLDVVLSKPNGKITKPSITRQLDILEMCVTQLTLAKRHRHVNLGTVNNFIAIIYSCVRGLRDAIFTGHERKNKNEYWVNVTPGTREEIYNRIRPLLQKEGW